MKLDPDQLEWIVREVVRRLRGEAPASPSSNSNDLAISDRVISTTQLDGKLDGVARLTIHRRAVVTPAAHDLLKQHSVELVRSDPS